ncbi:hypothetical protein ACTXT7_016621 [Hymenolepis weldensis]
MSGPLAGIRICECHHDPEADLTFDNRVDKCKIVFRKDLADISEEERVRHPLRRLCDLETQETKMLHSPKGIGWFKFEEAVSTPANCSVKNHRNFTHYRNPSPETNNVCITKTAIGTAL